MNPLSVCFHAYRHFWDAPYRPLFLAAAICAVVAIAWWPVGVHFGLSAPQFAPAVLWHVHEMFFGFAGAAFGGYLLTALPGWAGVPPERGLFLKALLLFWGLARCATAFADWLPLSVLLAANALYFVLLGGVILRRTLAAGAVAKSLFGWAVVALGTVEAVFMIATRHGHIADSLILTRGLLLGFALLLVVVATRLIPAFTKSWHQSIHHPAPYARYRPIERFLAAILLLGGGLAFFVQRDDLAYIFIALAALFTAICMCSWRSATTLANPLLFGLHAAYLWLPLGLALISGVWFFAPPYPMSGALHALTIGAMSGLIMAVSARAASHTASGVMKARKAHALAMAMLWLATCVRLAAPLSHSRESSFEICAAVLWCGSWSLFIFGFLPALNGPAPRPVLSGKKPETLTT